MSSRSMSSGYETLGFELSEIGSSRYIAPSYISDTIAGTQIQSDRDLLIRKQTSFLSARLLDDFPPRHTSSATILRPARKQRYKFASWKIGVATAATTTFAVLVTNCILLLWSSVHFGLKDGMGTAFQGKCSTVASWSLWLHILINALSSVLLGASSYTMQCVASPTRSECDRAHARGKWLDIGVPSLRNLTEIGRRRTVIWALLALSSIPIHLLYNSAVFKTLDANTYLVALAHPEFLEAQDHDLDIGSHAYDLRDVYVDNTTAFDKMTPEDCIATYATFFLSGHSDVIVITSSQADPRPGVPVSVWDAGDVEVGTANSVPYDWICPEQRCPDPAGTRQYAQNWTLNDESIDYCLSLRTEPRCKLQFSAYILAAVIVCNLIKAVAMSWTLWQQREATFVTFGDALSSWLDDPDETTKGRCMSSKEEIIRASKKLQLQLQLQPPAPRQAEHRVRRWRQAISRTRWSITIGLCITALAVVCILLGVASRQLMNQVYDNVFDTGFGKADGRMLVEGLYTEGASGLAGAVLLANSPQIVFSFIYILYNALFTGMHQAHEYGRYAVHRKPLRVTTPYGQQRRTYWLSLPFTYSIPLLITSTILHWLISQAVFLVRVEVQRSEFSISSYDSNSQSLVGFSPAAMLAVILVGSAATAVAIGMGSRKLEGGCMPCQWLPAARWQLLQRPVNQKGIWMRLYCQSNGEKWRLRRIVMLGIVVLPARRS